MPDSVATDKYRDDRAKRINMFGLIHSAEPLFYPAFVDQYCVYQTVIFTD